MDMNKTAFYMLLVSMFLTLSLAADHHDDVGTTARGCLEKQNQKLMVEKCWGFIGASVTRRESKPSKQCCEAIKNVHEFNCFCELVLNRQRWKLDVPKLDRALLFCGRTSGDCYNTIG